MSTYVCSDFHGFYSLYEQIHDFLKPEDHVYFLGDAADRGPNGWKLIKAILDDPQWTYLMGNHDLMFTQSIFGPDKNNNCSLHYYNGGEPTRKAFEEDTPENQQKYLTKLKNVVFDAHYINGNNIHIYMSHSGGVKEQEPTIEDLVWDRAHFGRPVPEGIDFIVHGHTTIPHLCQALNGLFRWGTEGIEQPPTEITPGSAYYYMNNQKIDVDNCTIATGACVLLNLDTFEEHPFFVSKEEKEFLW